MMQSILVPLDGSHFSEHALPIALGLARAHRACLHLAHVHRGVIPGLQMEVARRYSSEWDEEARARERSYLEEIAVRSREECGITVRATLLEGAVFHALLDYATGAGIDFIVMTTHGRGGLSRAWLGSVADEVVRQAGVPVLLLRPEARGAAPAFVPRLPFQHVLVPLDGSELAEQVLVRAAAIARLTGARLTLLRVYSMMPGIGGDLSGVGFSLAYIDATRAEAETYLAGVAERLRRQGLSVEQVLVRDARPAVAILDYAERNAVDLITMATHGRSAWLRFALGSVADKVVRGSHIPVLVLRPAPVPERESAPDAARSGVNVPEPGPGATVP